MWFVWADARFFGAADGPLWYSWPVGWYKAGACGASDMRQYFGTFHHIFDPHPLLCFSVLPSKKLVFRRMLVEKPSKKFWFLFCEENSPARSFCATTRYHPFPELGERDPNVFSMAHIAVFPYLGKKTINEVLRGKELLSSCKIRLELVLLAQETDDSES